MFKRVLLTGAGLLALAPSTYAAQSINFSPDSVSVETSLSVLNGESREFVYDEGAKASQLNWKINNAPIIKAGITWDPLSWLSLNANGWTTLASRGSGMDDYDWSYPSQSHWSDWSGSPDTHLNFANQFDLNVTGWLLKEDSFKLGALVGYQETRFSWLAEGGHYSYDNGADVGDFPRGERTIGYQQKYRVPYLGLTGKYVYQDFDITAQFKFSPWVEARDHDEHYMRDLSFNESASNSNYYSGTINAGYSITSQARVFTELSWTRFSEGKGGSTVHDKVTGDSEHYNDAAGIQNYNYAIGAGIEYRF